jgi:hypothetical protein
MRARFIMIVATTQGRPQVEVGIPKCHFPLMARWQHSELAIARIAALRLSICRGLVAGSMKLFFKRALTGKCRVSIGLELILNWAVLPSVAKGSACCLGNLRRRPYTSLVRSNLIPARALLLVMATRSNCKIYPTACW